MNLLAQRVIRAFADLSTTYPLIYHKEPSIEVFQTERQLRRNNLTPSPYSNSNHYAKSGFEGARINFDRREGAYYGIGLMDNFRRFMMTLAALGITEPTTPGFLHSSFEKEHGDVAQRLREEGNPLTMRDDGLFIDVNPVGLDHATRELFLRNYERRLFRLEREPEDRFIYVRPIGFRGDVRDSLGRIQQVLGVYSYNNIPTIEILEMLAKPYLASANPDNPSYPILVMSINGQLSTHASDKVGANYQPPEKDNAIYAGFADALLTTPRGRTKERLFKGIAGNLEEEVVTEGSGENVFFVKDDTLVTPPLNSRRFLPGTKRAYVLDIAKNLGIGIEQREVRVSELGNFDAMGVSGTWAGFVPVRMVDDPVTRKLYEFDTGNDVIQTLAQEYKAVTNGGPLISRENAGLRWQIRGVPLLEL